MIIEEELKQKEKKKGAKNIAEICIE